MSWGDLWDAREPPPAMRARVRPAPDWSRGRSVLLRISWGPGRPPPLDTADRGRPQAAFPRQVGTVLAWEELIRTCRRGQSRHSIPPTWKGSVLGNYANGSGSNYSWCHLNYPYPTSKCIQNTYLRIYVFPHTWLFLPVSIRKMNAHSIFVSKRITSTGVEHVLLLVDVSPYLSPWHALAHWGPLFKQEHWFVLAAALAQKSFHRKKCNSNWSTMVCHSFSGLSFLFLTHA